MPPVKDDTFSAENAVALSGSEYVRDRLLSLLFVGPRSIGNTYYAIKCRVKSEESLGDKVKKKKQTGRKYSAASVTDIVGLRILTIYSQDLINASVDFLEFIGFCQRSEISLFAGHEIDDAITEIIIYKSNTNTQAYDLVHSRLQRVPLRAKPNGSPKLILEEATENQTYSSIHILCTCLSHYARTPKVIPLEVQIRTIFEDAWNEVDHPLRYKGVREKIDLLTGGARNQAINLVNQLKVLKASVENAGSQADNIRDYYQIFNEGLLAKQGEFNPDVSPTASFELKHFRFGGFGDPSFARRFMEIDRDVNVIFAVKYADAARDIEIFKRRSADILTALEDLREAYGKGSAKDASSAAEFYYFTRMQEALVRTWRARLARFIAAKESLEFQREVGEALKVYIELENDDRFRFDCFLRLRFANCLSIRSDHRGYAFDKIREAAALLPKDRRVRKRGLIPLLIHRQHGYYAWLEKEALRKEGALLSVPGFRAIEQIALLEESIAATWMAVLSVGGANLPEKEKALESARSYNNVASYCWELWDQSEERFALLQKKLGLDFRPFADRILKGYGKERLQPGHYDSVLKSCFLAGDKQGVTRYKAKLRHALESGAAQRVHTMDEINLMKYTLQRLRASRRSMS